MARVPGFPCEFQKLRPIYHRPVAEEVDPTGRPCFLLHLRHLDYHVACPPRGSHDQGGHGRNRVPWIGSVRLSHDLEAPDLRVLACTCLRFWHNTRRDRCKSLSSCIYDTEVSSCIEMDLYIYLVVKYSWLEVSWSSAPWLLALRKNLLNWVRAAIASRKWKSTVLGISTAFVCTISARPKRSLIERVCRCLYRLVLWLTSQVMTALVSCLYWT